MVKKAKTPELPEEVRYYTCWKPYPNNADFEQPPDYIEFCRWIANALGDSSPLCAVYYKPRSRMVIFSVDKEYLRPERLLGEHRYSEFLKKPEKGEERLVSQIFYCKYHTERDVQKDGWKAINVENYFFANYGIDKWFTKVPYPAPHWCQTPPENITEKSLCHPLPGSQVPIPPELAAPVAPRPVVGTSAWVERRRSNPQHNNAPASGVGRGRPNGVGPQQKQPSGATKGPSIQPSKTSTQTSFPPLSPAAPATKNTRTPLSAPPITNHQSVWENKPSSVKFAAASAPLSGPPATVRPAWTDKRSKHSKPQANPVGSSSSANPPSTSSTVQPADKKNSSTSKGWSTKGGSSKTVNKDDSRTRATTDKTPIRKTTRKSGATSSSSSQTGGSSPGSTVSSAPSSPLPSSSALPQTSNTLDFNDYDYDDDYDEEITEETYHETWETASVYEPLEASSPSVHIGKGNKGKAEEVTYDHPFASAAAMDETSKMETTNLWADITPVIRPTGSKTAAEAHAEEKGEKLCPVHKGKCKRGICKEYKEILKQERKKQKNEEKAEKRRRKKEEEEEARKKKEGSEKENEEGGSNNATAAGNANRRDQKAKKGVEQTKRWADYSSDDDDDDDFGDMAALPAQGQGSSSKKYAEDDEFFKS